MKPQLKVGDKVEFIQYLIASVKRIGTVIKIEENHVRVEMDHNSKTMIWTSKENLIII